MASFTRGRCITLKYSSKYQDIVAQNLAASARMLRLVTWNFQRDNDPKQASKSPCNGRVTQGFVEKWHYLISLIPCVVHFMYLVLPFSMKGANNCFQIKLSY